MLCCPQSMEMDTPLMEKTASWLTPLHQAQELGETLTLMMMSSGHWEMAKVVKELYLWIKSKT